MTDLVSYSGAHHFLDGLAALDIQYVFANLGTDHVSLIEDMARREREGVAQPQLILCPHENVAMHMAAGYAAITGRGQAVMVHVDSGTANSAMGAHNLFRGRLPVLLIAGKAPYTLRGEMPGSRDNYVHFIQDPFDIASLVRPFVKWEYSLPTGRIAPEVLRRAHSVMHSDPAGPVFLTLPREVLAESIEGPVQAFDAQRYGPVLAGGLDPERVDELVTRLMQASSPVVVTTYLGRKAEAVKALEDLALLCGIRVVEFMPSHLAMSRSHPCFAGFDPTKALTGADLGLLLDVDVPWLPKFVQPEPQTWWAQVDVDPIKQDFPMWGFATDWRAQGDCATVLRQLAARVRERADDAFESQVAARIASWGAARTARRQAVEAAAASPGQVGALSAAHVCAALGRALDAHDIVVSEAVRNSPAVLTQIPRSEPLTLLCGAGGGLGYGGGMAMGARLACPNRRVVHVVGDGGFHFSTPTSVYATAQSYGLPVFTVVLDNGGWQAVKEAVLRVYPDGEAAQADEFQSRLQGAQRRFEKVAEAFGGHGEYLDDPAQVDAAIARCLQAIDAGRSAVLNVQLGLQ